MSNGPFTDEIVSWAKAAERTYQIPASLNLSAAMLESALGKSTPPHTNNWHGIKDAHNPEATATEEQAADGSWYTIEAGFKVFPTPADSFMYYGHLLGLAKPYHDMVTTFLRSPRGAADVQKLSHALTGVYASAHTYGDQLVNIQKQFNLYQYDAPTQQASLAPTPPAPIAPPAQPASVPATPNLDALMNFLPVLLSLASDIPQIAQEIETMAQNPAVLQFIQLIESFMHVSPPTAGNATLLEVKAAPTAATATK